MFSSAVSRRTLIAAVALQALLIMTICPANVQAFTTTTSLSSERVPFVLQAHARRAHTYIPKLNRQNNNNDNSNGAASNSSSESSVKIFQDMDRNGNGKVDLQEMKSYLQTKGSYTDAVARSIFERLDTQHKGELGLQELETGMKDHNLFQVQTPAAVQEVPAKADDTFAVKSKNRATRPNNKSNKRKDAQQFLKQEATKLFELIDHDHDGFISLQELKEHFLVVRMKNVAQSSGLLGRLKSNNKQKSQQQDTSSTPWHHSEIAIQKLFQVLDENSDGRISLPELKQAFLKHPSVRHAFQT